MSEQTTLMSRCDHTQSGTDTSCCDGSSVAMVQKTTISWQQCNAVINQALSQSAIFSLYFFCQVLQGKRINGRMSSFTATHPIKSPAKVDSRGA